MATIFEAVNAIYMLLCADAEIEGPFQTAIRSARDEVAHRFFRLESKFCCRLLFTGVNIARSIPSWLQEILPQVLSLMAAEVELFTGAIPPASPRDMHEERYNDRHSLIDIINGSSGPSEAHQEVFGEIHNFISMPGMLGGSEFTRFSWHWDRFPHLQMLAMQLRSFPTSTLCLERIFSLARRVLSWSRMRLTPQNAGDMCLLTANQDLAQKVLGIDTISNLAVQTR